MPFFSDWLRFEDGSVLTLVAFATRCANEWDLTPHVNDPLPEQIVPNTAAQDAERERLQAHLDHVLAMTPEQAEYRAYVEHREATKDYMQAREISFAHLDRFSEMRTKVVSWSVPDDVKPLKDFMMRQLDGAVNFYSFARRVPERLNGPAWIAREVSETQAAMRYVAKRRDQEITNAAERDSLLQSLRASLAAA